MMTESFREREAAVLLAWLDRYPATVMPPQSDRSLWMVVSDAVQVAGESPMAALRAYRKAMMAVRRRPRPTADGAK